MLLKNNFKEEKNELNEEEKSTSKIKTFSKERDLHEKLLEAQSVKSPRKKEFLN
jgi:hypothetical protein